jgi:hypothetical protein
MATISNTPRPGYVWDATDNVWYPIGVGGHSHGEIPATIADAKGDLIAGTAADTVDRLAVGANGETLVCDSSTSTGLRYNPFQAAGKNRIINGAMIIDQRNAGAAVTVNANAVFYPVDRFNAVGETSDGVFTLQQSTSTPPAGLINYVRATVTTADASIGASQRYFFRQSIEANQLYDFGLGTLAAKTFTLSFYVRSSLTGTFSGSMRSSSGGRSYVFSYTINAANTWERKSITLTGDTTGTWSTGVNVGIILSWSLGAGSTLSTTANAWTAGNFFGETGASNVIATLGATWDVTGVQLELGSVATEFTLAGATIQGELAACQRYYFRFGGSSNYQRFANGLFQSSTQAWTILEHPVPMRANPTATDWSSIALFDGNSVMAITSLVAVEYAPNATGLLFAVASGSAQYRPAQIFANNTTSAYLGLSAEL